MTPDDFRRIVLALDGAVEASHMNHPDFRVNGRIFASLSGEPQKGMATLAPADQQRFIADEPDVFHSAAGAWGAMGCTLMHLRHANEESVGEALTLAWRLALSKGPARMKAKAAKASKTARIAPRAANGGTTRRRR
jgi:hypothetical protein